MPHRQQQAGHYLFFSSHFFSSFIVFVFTENGIDHTVKRKRTKDKSQDREKKPRTSTKEWSATPTDIQDSKPSTIKPSTVPNQITFGRFEFNTDETVEINSKKKKPKKLPNKQKQLINTLKKVESEQDELIRLQEENPNQGKEILRSKHWKTALAKAKGEKVRDNVQLLRKSIKKQTKIRERSAKKWQKNKSEIDKRMKERQEKRKTNLQKRKDDKKSKLKKKLIKKGRLIS
jgi:hypothetical protein